MSDIKRFIKRRKEMTLIYVLLATLTAWFSAQLSILLGKFFEVAEGNFLDPFRTLVINTIVCLVIYVTLNLGLDVIKGYFLRKIGVFVKKNFAGKVMQKEITEFNKYETNEYISILVNDTKQIDELFVANYFNILKNFSIVIVSLGVLLTINILGTVLVLVLSFLPIILAMLFGPHIGQRINEYKDGKHEYIKRTSELLGAHDSFIIYGNRDKAQSSHESINGVEMESKRKAFVVIETLSSVIGICALSVTILTMVFGMFLALNGYITIGEVFALSFISNGISTPLIELLSLIPQYIGGEKLSQRYQGYIETHSLSKPSELTTLEHNITLKQISLGNEQKILNNVEVNFEIGKKYLLIGKSGSGKSTIAKIIMGQIEGYTGDVLWDGVDLKNISDETIYDNISYLSQTNFVFQDTIRNNIRMFDPNISDEQIYDVLDFVNLRAKVESLPEKLDYIINESKTNFSGGEKQRLAMARALVFIKPVIIMDEATSALDNVNFRDIEKKILSLENTTLINIVHRLQDDITALYDHVIRLESGEVVVPQTS